MSAQRTHIWLRCRERAAGMYGVIPYAIAQGAVELPWALAQSVVYACITYFMIYFEINAGSLPLQAKQDNDRSHLCFHLELSACCQPSRQVKSMFCICNHRTTVPMFEVLGKIAVPITHA